VIAIAGPIELIGGTLVMIGLFSGWAAFLCSGLMALAYWMAHGTQALLPIQNMGELAALFCFVFLYITSQGSGVWSGDATRGKAQVARMSIQWLSEKKVVNAGALSAPGRAHNMSDN